MAEIIVDYNKLQESASLIEKEINNLKGLFDKENSYFELLADNKMWSGTSNENCINKYKEIKPKYEEILSGLNNYKQFLLNVAESYKNFNNMAVQKMDNQ